MPPKTRSKGKAPAAPASRTYHSSPAPQQVTFPPRQRVIKTYGRKATAVRPLRQQTLTQLDYVTQSTPDDRDVLVDDPIDDAIEKPSKKRRKTMGDTPSSSYHTQTLTQFLSEKTFSGKGSDEDNALMIRDSEDDEDDGLAATSEGGGGSKESSLVPETPSNRRIKVNLDEVPSSQPTPFTPMLERYTPGSGRSPLIERSTNVNAPPPTEETINKIPRNITIEDSFSPSRGLLSSLPPSSIKEESTPTNRPHRQPLADITTPTLEARGASTSLGYGSKRSGKENKKRAFVEIPDSDDDFSNFSPTPVKQRSIRRSSQKIQDDRKVVAMSNNTVEVSSNAVDWSRSTAVGSGTPIAGPSNTTARPSNTEIEDEIADEGYEIASVEVTSSEDGCPGTPTPLARRVRIDLPPHSSPSVFEETPQRHRNKSSPLLQRNTPRQTQRQTQRNTQRQTQMLHHYSQGLESQRVPLDVLNSLGPLTEESDILISTPPEAVEAIVKGHKDHEFRAYRLPREATRCWIYTSLPVGEVKYMATIGPPKGPGEIDGDTGIGNPEFNNRRSGYHFAYHLDQVYQLNNPVPLALMKQNGLGENPPQMWRYVPPAIVGQLLGNLRCALFAEGDEEDEDDFDPLIRGTTPHDVDNEVDPTISQELEDQIRSDIIHSTQLLSSEATHEEFIPASQVSSPRSRTRSSTAKAKQAAMPRNAPTKDDFALPTLPASVTRSSSRIQGQNRRQPMEKTPSTVRRSDYVRPSQATTASQASTQIISPEKSSVPRPLLGSNVPSDDFLEEESPLQLARSELSLGSSQPVLLDSLLVDEMRPPPELLDSDDDEYNDGLN